MASVSEKVRGLYEGEDPTAQRFRYGLLIFDVATILFVILTSFFRRNGWVGRRHRPGLCCILSHR